MKFLGISFSSLIGIGILVQVQSWHGNKKCTKQQYYYHNKCISAVTESTKIQRHCRNSDDPSLPNLCKNYCSKGHVSCRIGDSLGSCECQSSGRNKYAMENCLVDNTVLLDENCYCRIPRQQYPGLCPIGNDVHLCYCFDYQ